MSVKGTETLSVVIPTLRRPDDLRTALRSLSSCQPSPQEVLVVDGDSDGRSAEPIVREFARTLVIRYVASTPGLPRQRNAGLEIVQGEIVCFLDDDVTVSPEAFRHLKAAFRQQDVVGATGRVIEHETRSVFGKHSALRRFLPGGGREGTFTRYGYPHRLVHLNEARDLEFMHGSFMCVRTRLARQLRFDEALEGYALGEDEDFSFRLSRQGRIRYVPEAVVHHRKTGFSSSDQRRFGRTVVRNRAYLFRKNFPQTPLARAQFWLFIGMLIAHRLLNREWAGARGLMEGSVAVVRGEVVSGSK
jgi:GT2 family glycosyltransferase